MTTAALARALELASVSGVFSPDGIARAVGLGAVGSDAGGIDGRDALWRALDPLVDEALPGMGDGGGSDGGSEGGPGYGWVLRPDVRREQLAQFATRAQLDRALEGAPRPRPGDAFGRMLRAVLAGREPAVENGRTPTEEAALLARLDRSAALFDAAQVAAVVPALDGARLADLGQAAKRQVKRLQQLRNMTVVLPGRHFGYAAERRRLSDHLRGRSADPRPMLLTGLGGAGKSALVARLVRHWQRRRDAPATVVLDFDRRQLNAGEPVEAMQELLRQLESWVPEKVADPGDAALAAEGLRALRHALPKFDGRRDLRTHLSQMGYIHSDTLARLAQGWARPLRDLPIALILDSFESVDRQGGAVVGNLLDLEAALRAGGLGRLRTVISGRADPLGTAAGADPLGHRLTLRGLSVEAGQRLLAEEDGRLAAAERSQGGEGRPALTDAGQRRKVSRLLGGHPLTLLIFARYARTRPEDVADLVRDLDADPEFRAALAQSFLYDRILERIADDDVRALAHPGLVLRELNADLVRFVLAGPCLGHGPDDEAPLGEAAAGEVLDRLGRQYWLVDDADPPFALRHRPDLRRLMLPALFAGPTRTDGAERARRKQVLREGALAVCRAAAAYFEAGPPTGAEAGARERWEGIDPGHRHAQALHYRAFLRPEEAPEFGPEVAASLDGWLGEDVDTLPLAWRARVRALLGRRLGDAERATLKGDVREAAEREAFAKAAQVGWQFAAKADNVFGALEPSTARGAPPPSAARPAEAAGDAAALERRILAAFAQAEFDAVAALAVPYLAALPRRGEEETERRFHEAETTGYWRHPLWKCLLLAGAGAEGAAAMAAAARAAKAEETPYGPICRALVAATTGDVEGVREGLGPVLRRDLASPVDFNRARGPDLARLVVGTPGSETELYPSALALAAVDSSYRHRPDDVLAASLLPFVPGRDKTLDAIGRMYGLDRSQRRTTFHPSHHPGGVRIAPTRSTETLRVFRGLSPELHDPLAAMLIEGGPDLAVRLARRLDEAAPLWPRELVFEGPSGYHDAQAATVVETADQCGVLRGLAAALAEADPRAGTVVAMFDRITAWFFPFAEGIA